MKDNKYPNKSATADKTCLGRKEVSTRFGESWDGLPERDDSRYLLGIAANMGEARDCLAAS